MAIETKQHKVNKKTTQPAKQIQRLFAPVQHTQKKQIFISHLHLQSHFHFDGRMWIISH